jgi:hypothetical protein
MGHRTPTAIDERRAKTKLPKWPGRSGDVSRSVHFQGRCRRLHASLAWRRHVRAQNTSDHVLTGNALSFGWRNDAEAV